MLSSITALNEWGFYMIFGFMFAWAGLRRTTPPADTHTPHTSVTSCAAHTQRAAPSVSTSDIGICAVASTDSSYDPSRMVLLEGSPSCSDPGHSPPCIAPPRGPRDSAPAHTPARQASFSAVWLRVLAFLSLCPGSLALCDGPYSGVAHSLRVAAHFLEVYLSALACPWLWGSLLAVLVLVSYLRLCASFPTRHRSFRRFDSAFAVLTLPTPRGFRRSARFVGHARVPYCRRYHRRHSGLSRRSTRPGAVANYFLRFGLRLCSLRCGVPWFARGSEPNRQLLGSLMRGGGPGDRQLTRQQNTAERQLLERMQSVLAEFDGG